MQFADLVLSLLWRIVRIHILQFLRSDKEDLFRQNAFYVIIFVCHVLFRHAESIIYRLNNALQSLYIALVFGDDLFPIPLIDIDGMDIVGILITTDGVHIRI